MNTTSNYSNSDLVLAAGATAFTGLCVIVAEFNLVSTVQEVIVFAQEIYNAREKYPNNSLIQAMTASFSQSLTATPTTISQPTTHGNSENTDIIEPIEVEYQKVKPQNILDFTVDFLKTVLDGLTSKVPPEELREFKEFLYGLGEAIAKAAGEGQWGTGEKISPREAKVLEQIKGVLGI